jgi:hypothetical protein
MQIAIAARIGLKIVAALAGVIVALCLASLALNLVDEDLTPATRALLAAPPNPYPPADNLYVAMAGLDARAGRSIVEAGEARIAAYNAAVDSMLADPDAVTAIGRRAEPDKLTFRGDAKQWPVVTGSIWGAARGQGAQIAAQLAANQELCQRYRSLHALHGYYETARPGYLAPMVFVPQSVRSLFLADVAARIQSGGAAQQRAALEDLAADLELWRAVLRGRGGLVSKMLAAAALHADLLVVGDLVTDAGTDLALLDGERQALVTPFALSDWQIGDVFRTELRASAAYLKPTSLANSPVVGSSARPASWWERQWNGLQVQFFKLNATQNLFAERAERLRALASADPGQFSAARAEYQRWLAERGSIASLHGLYNPVGRILLETSANVFDGYPRRVYDVAALQRLVVLAYQLRRQGIPAAGVAAFMTQHPQWATHPVDAKPFRWEAASGTLTVLTAGVQPEGRRFSLTLSAAR